MHNGRWWRFFRFRLLRFLGWFLGGHCLMLRWCRCCEHLRYHGFGIGHNDSLLWQYSDWRRIAHRLRRRHQLWLCRWHRNNLRRRHRLRHGHIDRRLLCGKLNVLSSHNHIVGLILWRRRLECVSGCSGCRRQLLEIGAAQLAELIESRQALLKLRRQL